MTIKNLIDFIDKQTNNGAVDPNESLPEEIKKEGITLIHSFSASDWLALYTLDLKNKSNSWVELLIHLLDAAYTEQARQMIIQIALTGREENFWVAMEYIRSFRRDITIYTWLKLKNRAAEISRSRSSERRSEY